MVFALHAPVYEETLRIQGSESQLGSHLGGVVNTAAEDCSSTDIQLGRRLVLASLYEVPSLSAVKYPAGARPSKCVIIIFALPQIPLQTAVTIYRDATNCE
jgi:hypothetical protein